ncbi:hypothetical protein T1I15_06620 [Lactiplantibacillus plantarum]|nr:hypothetical protein T1I15_06620 [Lactiplantibacillus plantarum]
MELKDLDRLVEKYARQGYQQIRVKAGDLEIEVTKPALGFRNGNSRSRYACQHSCGD